MRTKLMLVAFGAALMVTSCSQDEVVSVNQENAIVFRASTTSATRATTQYDNFTLDAFKVYAYDEANNAFMDGVEVTKSGSDWTYSPLKYWPNDGTLDFYSFAPSDFTGYSNKAFGAYTVSADAAGQIDLLYAYNKGVSKQEAAVNVNFRHALSQIVFKAKKTENCNLDIVIDGVQIVNAANASDGFTFPDATTSDKFLYGDANADPAVAPYYDATNVGSWAKPSKTEDAQPFTAGITSTTVTTTTADITTAGTGALMLLPQTLTAWNPQDAPSPKAEGQKGTYFMVKCSIKDDKTYLWGSANETKYVAIPLGGAWEIGKRYEYTFVFGEGAGYNPDPTPDPEDPDPDPEPVLVPITFTVSIDDFVPGNNVDLSKDWPTTEETEEKEPEVTD